jgi:DNA repair exonuclease SbcCD ATPase subunit
LELEKQLHDLVAELNPQLTTMKAELKLVLSKRKSILDRQNKLATEVLHLETANCPYCLQKFENSDAKLSEIKIELATVNEDEITVCDQMVNLEIKVQELDAQITEAKSLMMFSSLAAAMQAKTAADTAAGRISELEVAENPHVDALESLKKNSVAEISYDELNALKRELDHEQFLLKLLTNKDSFIRRRIINQTIPFLNKRLNTYTKEIGLQHIVKFDDDMSCTVSEYGRELDFGNLSSGEKKRVNLSLSLAFRDVLHHLHSKFNCLFIDEIDASLDGTGVEQIFKLLKQKTRDDGLGMWIISHRPEATGRFDRSITVRKENGFSQIIED